MKIVLTGGPGVGKTTLINELSKTYKIIPEHSRELQAQGYSPQKDFLLFQQKVIEKTS